MKHLYIVKDINRAEISKRLDQSTFFSFKFCIENCGGDRVSITSPTAPSFIHKK